MTFLSFFFLSFISLFKSILLPLEFVQRFITIKPSTIILLAFLRQDDSKKHKKFERIFRRKHVKRIATAATPLVLAASTTNPLVASPLASILIGEVAPPVAQVPSPMSDLLGSPKEVPTEVENITTPFDKVFIIEAIVLAKKTPKETMDVTNPPAGMISTTSLLKEIRVKAVDSIYALKESLVEVIFSSPTVRSLDNLSQSSIDAMPKNFNAGVVVQEGLNMTIGLLRGLLLSMKRQILMEHDPHMTDALGSFIWVSNIYILFIIIIIYPLLHFI